VPDAEEPEDEEGEDYEEAAKDEEGLAALGLEGTAAGAGGSAACGLVEAGIGESGGVEAVMGAGAAVDEELVALGAFALGFDAGGLLDDAVELIGELLELLLLVEELALALIQGAAGFAGTTA
jgi:hypothetical protein